jgi:hypothetical protein
MTTRIIVFEDTGGGIRSARAAVNLLRKAGIPIEMEAVGIADQAVKRNALSGLADRLFGDVNQALTSVLP